MLQAQILIVEDEAIIAMDIEGQLTELGYTVLPFVVSGEEAIEQAKVLQPDLILMDIKLAGPMDGIETATLIRDTMHIPVVYLTSHSDEAILHRAQATDPHGYLLKPFGSRELHSTMQMALHRHNVEEQLRQSEALLSAFVTAMPDLGLILDVNGTYIEIMAHQEGLLVDFADNLKGRTISEAIPEHTAATIMNAIHDTVETNIPQYVQYQLDVLDGSRWFEAKMAPMPTAPGVPPQVVSIARDITERKETEDALSRYREQLEDMVTERTAKLEEVVDQLRTEVIERVEAEKALETAHQSLRQLDKLKDNFLDGVSHELRTPIANLKLYHHLLGANPQKSDAYLDTLGQTTDRLETIVEQMIYVTRMYRDFDSMEAAPVNVYRLISDVLERHISTADENNITFYHDMDPDVLIHVSGDEALLNRVIDNIVTNALNYTPDQGEVRISTEMHQDRHEVVLEIADTGPGIPEQELTMIFDRFFRGTAALQHGIPGSGLGLFVAKMIVERHDGAIEVRNAQGHTGTIISITLPYTIA